MGSSSNDKELKDLKKEVKGLTDKQLQQLFQRKAALGAPQDQLQIFIDEMTKRGIPSPMLG